MPKASKPDVSVVLPVFNDAARVLSRVPDLIQWFEAEGLRFEIILVDDGSDSPEETAKAARKVGARCVKYPRNQGKGFAVKAGMLAARGTYCVFTDSDVPYDFEALNWALLRLKKGADFVYGDRSDVRSVFREATSFRRRIASSIFAFLISNVFRLTKVGDTQCGLKAFRRSVARELFSALSISSFAFDVELFVLAQLRGYNVEEVPVRLRAADSSSLRLFADARKMVRDLWRIRDNLRKGRYLSHSSQREPTRNTSLRDLSSSRTYRRRRTGT